MASTTGWNTSTMTGAIGNDQSLNNSSGFNAFPEGNRNFNGSFNDEGYNAFFWSSTEAIQITHGTATACTTVTCQERLQHPQARTAFRCVLLGIKNLTTLLIGNGKSVASTK